MFVRARAFLGGWGRGTGKGEPSSPWVDLLVLLLLGAVLASFIALGREWAGPLARETPIDTSFTALPWYTLLSLCRGLLAYLLSLTFTIVYGTMAAHSRRAERVLIPVLDVLQSIPVLSFVPGFVIGLVALFPGSNVGLELACVLAIFTGQVWNMTFSYHASLRAIPREMNEVARLHDFGFRKRLLVLEIPSAMIGLVWNSMMSMAGGWFFLTVVESFRLGGQPYRLPGLGSYMAAAIETGDGRAIAAGAVAMVLMIVLVDRLLWHPLLAWSERFKQEETAAPDRPRSFIYDLIRRSRLLARIRPWFRRRADAGTGVARVETAASAVARRMLARAVMLVAGVLVVWGGWHLAVLLVKLRPAEWARIAAALGYSTLRVAAAILAGAAWAVPVGIAIGRSPRAARVLQPFIQVAASFPAPMIFPLVAPALAALGVGGNTVAVTLMLISTQWYILFNVVAGAAAVPHDMREVAAVFGLGRAARFAILYLGAVFPYLVTGVVTAAGGAWNATIVAEAVHYGGGAMTVEGIGSLIASSFDKGNDALLAAATVALAALLVLVNRLGWRRLYRLSDRRFAMNR
ncbi:MAG TPA: ABC transporter permease subunit [Planctomycetota bacterium]|nr:ABC transporter permease subunit [Planctomycetota bacterium]